MPRLSEEDRVIIRRLIGDGKTNDEILQAIDNRCSKTNIYQMRHGIKKSGGGGA